jgi:hypothetical protein
VLRALTRLFRRSHAPDPAQLGLDLVAPAPPPRTADELLVRLRSLGLRGFRSCRLTRNRSVVVSFSGGELRVHEAFLAAPPVVLASIVAFACGRTRAIRAGARRRILAFPIERPPPVRRPRERAHPRDEPLVRELERWHADYNRAHFGGQLGGVTIRISRRMKTRLGHYGPARGDDDRAEIVISRRHLRRHGWEEARQTLLHEMVHQWQDEHGHPIDHGPTFRARARGVGITPSARRLVASQARPSETDVMQTDAVETPPPPGLRVARDG